MRRSSTIASGVSPVLSTGSLLGSLSGILLGPILGLSPGPLPGPLPGLLPVPTHATTVCAQFTWDGELGDSVGACLRAWGADASLSEGRLTRAVADLGPRVLPELLHVLDDERYPASTSGESSSYFSLDPRQGGALIRALDAWPRELVTQALVAFGSAPARPSRAGTALHLIGEWGLAQEFELLALLAAPEGARPSVARTRREQYEDALTRLVERVPEVATLAAVTIQTLPESLRWPCLRALARGGDRTVVLQLARVAHRETSLAPLALGQLGHAARRLQPHYDEAAATLVRELLELAEDTLLVSAASAAGALEDADAVPLLLPLVEHADQAVRASALAALERIALVRVGSSRESWERWYREQSRWRWREAPADLKSLRLGNPAEVVAATNRLAKRVLYRHQLAPALGGPARGAHPGVALVACAALGQLGSARGAEALTVALGHEDPRVRSSAESALTRIWGRDLGPDPAAWRELWD